MRSCLQMLEKPLVHNDEYAYVQERQIKQKLKESSSRRSLSVSNKTLTIDNSAHSLPMDGRIGRFRYTDNQNERVEKQLQTNAIYDPIPNQNIHHTFSKIVRKRQENKELAG